MKQLVRTECPSAAKCRQSRKVMLMIIASLAVGVFAAGCAGSSPTTAEGEETSSQADDSGDTSTETGGIELSALSQREQLVVDMLVDGVSERPNVWDGFSLSDIPTVIPLVEDDEITSGFVMFHPNPTAAGEAVPVLGVDGIADLFYVPEVVDVDQPDKFSFDIDADVGGTETYVFPADFELINLIGPEIWSSVLVHETFHVFQIRSWTGDELIDQQSYDLNARNYELALLEDQALIAAWQGSGDETTEALRHFLALRATRLDEFPTTRLDNAQEIREGAAEWFERQHMGRHEVDEPWNNPASGNLGDPEGFAIAEAPNFAGRAPIQRFYYTGATQFDLLERMGLDWQPRVEQFEAPADILAEVVLVDPSEYGALIEEARSAYDPDGNLPSVAEIWLSAEPGGEFDNDVETPVDVDETPQDIVDCFASFGITIEQLEADPTALTPEANQECVIAYEDRVNECLEEAGISLEGEAFELTPEAEACFE